MNEIRALVVDDDPNWQEMLSEILRDANLTVDEADSLQAVEPLLRAIPYRLAVVDLALAGGDHNNQDGLRILDAIRQHNPGCVSFLLTGFATVEIAVDSIQKHGAYTCLRKDRFRRAEFRKIIRQALATLPAKLPKEQPVQNAPAPAEPRSASTTAQAGRVLLVEDDAGWRSLLSELLADAGYRVDLASSYVEAFGRLNQVAYQLAVIDLSLSSSLHPDHNLDGFRLLEMTRKANLPTIIVSGFAEPSRIEQAYKEKGVFACLEKQNFERSAFRQALLDAQAHILANQPFKDLTAREREVLNLLIQGQANKEMASALYVTPNTIKRHLKSIFKKLGVASRAGAVAKAMDSKFVRLGTNQ